MKQLVKILLVTMCFMVGSSVNAQQKRIFFFEAGNSINVDSAKAAISSVFTGEVESGKELPADFSSYDLIYVYGNPAQLDHIRLVEHLKIGGQLFLDMWPNSQIDDGDSLFHFLGISIIGLTSAVSSKGVSGVSGTFADQFHLNDPTFVNEHFPNLLDMLRGVKPKMQLVLQAEGPSELAWVKSDDGFRAMLFTPQVNYYYKPFISYALCNYFQLCVLDVATTQDNQQIIAYDPLRSELHLPSEGSIVISDILGREVFSKEVGESRFLRLDLTSGNYIVRWQSGSEHVSTKISVR